MQISGTHKGCVSINACFSEVLTKLLDNDLVCVVDSALIGVITKKDIYWHIETNPNCYEDSKAIDICNKDFAYTTLDTIDADQDKLKRFKQLPLLDKNGKLIYVLNVKSSNGAEWNNAQEHEINWWRTRLSKKDNWDNKDELKLLPERIYDENVIKLLQDHACKKVCLEIGAGPRFGYLPSLSQASKRIIIEPLAEKYRELRVELNISIPNTEDFIHYPIAADNYIKDLENSIDGLIICQNALDHTPNWMFILNNISSYATKGCYFYLWTDIDHGGATNKGHFNITQNPLKMFQLIENLGFDLIYKRVHVPSSKLNVCCVGVKR